MITVNQVYDRLATALSAIAGESISGETVVGEVYCTKYYNRINEHLPCVYFRESHSPVFKYIQMDRQDNQIRLVCYVEVYGYDIDLIVATVEQTFKEMFFIEELCEMIPNYDPDVERVSLRFQRIITGGDTLGEENQGSNQGDNQGSGNP